MIIRTFAQAMPYSLIFKAMKDFTLSRTDTSEDEIWVLEHQPVFTQGQAGKPEHILQSSDIPIIQSDRGGQVTYHGPGQLVIYPLLNLKVNKLGVRDVVTLLEQSVIEYLATHNIVAKARCDAPGVYVNDAKIASVGLRIKRGCSYHGLSFNINMDLNPFSFINPCGFKSLAITQLQHFVSGLCPQSVQQKFLDILINKLPQSNTKWRNISQSEFAYD